MTMIFPTDQLRDVFWAMPWLTRVIIHMQPNWVLEVCNQPTEEEVPCMLQDGTIVLQPMVQPHCCITDPG